MTEDLPSKEDRLFCESEDWWNNACLNFTHDGLYLYGYGYKEAADILVNSVLESGERQDILIHPIAFCYRHYLELSCKMIFKRSSILLDEPYLVPNSHSIDKLWLSCLSKIEKIAPGECTDSINEITRLLHEFCQIDPFATAFRYPNDKHGNTSLEGLQRINIRNLGVVINKIDTIIHGILERIHEYQSYKNEIESNI